MSKKNNNRAEVSHEEQVNSGGAPSELPGIDAGAGAVIEGGMPGMDVGDAGNGQSAMGNGEGGDTSPQSPVPSPDAADLTAANPAAKTYSIDEVQQIVDEAVAARSASHAKEIQALNTTIAALKAQLASVSVPAAVPTCITPSAAYQMRTARAAVLLQNISDDRRDEAKELVARLEAIGDVDGVLRFHGDVYKIVNQHVVTEIERLEKAASDARSAMHMASEARQSVIDEIDRIMATLERKAAESLRELEYAGV